MKKIFTSLLCGLMSTAAFAQWSPTSMHGERTRPEAKVTKYYSLNLDQIRGQLASAQESGKGAVAVEIKLPTLDGKIERFAVYSAPVVVKSLADKYQLGSYAGVGIDDPSKYVRFSVAPNDFQSMMFSDGKYEFIEPMNSQKSVYGVFPKSDKPDGTYDCHTQELLSGKQIEKLGKKTDFSNQATNFSKNSDQKFRTYRLALSTNGEYTQLYGGVPGALVQMNATMTRVNGVFEKDFAIRLLLQDFPQIIFTDPATDPYTTMANWNSQLKTTLMGTTYGVGDPNYDIGHLFGSTGGGGSAGCIGCVCNSSNNYNSTYGWYEHKGQGYTSPGSGLPQGDNFDIDYVAHEMGHQLGAWHTFSHSIQSGGAQMEPGSGSSIMGYAGITSANVQAHSDPYFHAISIAQVETYVKTQNCDINTPITNKPPVVAAMPDVTIPNGTAFVLTASATDPENDPITYTWEQYDVATTAVTNVTANNTTGPKFRSITGSTLPYRYFPKLSMVMAGNLGSQAEWESVSNVARTMNFKVTVRDNNANVAAQQTQFGSQIVNVHANGPFKITSTKVYNNAPGPITWNVVGTNAAPFNVANVKIDYTQDNGVTWTTLAESTPNDGTENISFASFPTNSTLKLRISAIGNVFYAVAPVTVSAMANCDGTAPTGLAVSNITINSAQIIWDPLANATYILRYKKTADATWTEVPLSTNTYAMTGLAEKTGYSVQVAAVCSGVTGNFSAIVNFTTLELLYPTAGATSTSFEKISNVTVANINNNSTSTAGYEDFTSVVGKMNKSVTYPFSANFTGTSYTSDQVLVWIDFNQDKDFDDAGEAVMVSTKNKSPWTGSITIPADAKTGSTRMRVRLHDSSLGPNATPVGTSTYGQVEDYTVEIGTLAVDQSNVSSMQVYPNPATDVLNISKVSDKATYTIYNMAGQAISKGKVINNKVQVSQLPKGVYTISVNNNEEVSQVKFIKK